MTKVTFLSPCETADKKLKFAAFECLFLTLTSLSFWI